MLNHVAELVKNGVVLGKDEGIAELRTEGMSLHRNRITDVFVAHEQGGRDVVAFERRLRLAQTF